VTEILNFGFSYSYPVETFWFVLSEHQGDQIYYEKAIFPCDGRVATVLAILYFEARRHRFDPVVEQIEDRFKAGHLCS
jgi:hypothetical protein